MFVAAALAVQVWYGTYSVLDLGKPGVPVLTPIQKYWLRLVHRAPGYKNRWTHLRFAEQPANEWPKPTPLIVFDPDGWTPTLGPNAMFHVIGEPCNAYYSPADRQYRGPTEASCVSNHSPPPVPCEEQVLGGPGP